MGPISTFIKNKYTVPPLVVIAQFAMFRRKFTRGLKRKPMALIKKLRKKKKECPVNEKPDVVKTHLRNMIVVPEMTGSIVGVYNGKVFTQVEIKPEMIGHYLGEFSISYKVRLDFIRTIMLMNCLVCSL